MFIVIIIIIMPLFMPTGGDTGGEALQQILLSSFWSSVQLEMTKYAICDKASVVAHVSGSSTSMMVGLSRGKTFQHSTSKRDSASERNGYWDVSKCIHFSLQFAWIQSRCRAQIAHVESSEFGRVATGLAEGLVEFVARGAQSIVASASRGLNGVGKAL
jgi:hypothetical protein